MLRAGKQNSEHSFLPVVRASPSLGYATLTDTGTNCCTDSNWLEWFYVAVFTLGHFCTEKLVSIAMFGWGGGGDLDLQ